MQKQDVFYGYSNLEEAAADLNSDHGAYFLDAPHTFHGGDVVVKPDNDTGGHKLGLVVWNASDQRAIIVRDPKYDAYNDVDAGDWKYTGLRSSRLNWIAFWSRHFQKKGEQANWQED